VAKGLLDVFYEGPEQNRVMVAELPMVAAARQRDWEARIRLAAGEKYKHTDEELLEARAWGRRGRR
jgi:hypothetical protein